MSEQTNDLAAFGRLIERHYAAVTAVAFATTRDLALTEDIAQETFVAAWDGRARLRDPERVRPWLCGIARNRSRNALRRRRREHADEHELADATPSVIEQAIDRETHRALAASLAAIPAEHREVLVLFYWEERSIAEVAATLAISEAAAQKRISRARKHLQDELAAELEHTGRQRKAASASVAMLVLAVLAARPGGAHATTASKGSAMSIRYVVKSFAFVGVASALVAGAALWHQHATDAAPAVDVTRAAAPEGKAPVAARTPALPDPAPTTRTAAPRALKRAAAYEITPIGLTSVGVNLEGGRAEEMYSPDDQPTSFMRHVRGRVLDAQGKPVSGAAVLLGADMYSFHGVLMGGGGAITAADGTFDVGYTRDDAPFAIVFHTSGWSLPTAVPRGDAELTLTVPVPGGIAVDVRQGKEGREANVIVERPGMRLHLESDVHGKLELPRLAPGSYTVSVSSAQEFAGGSGVRIKRDVAVSSGATVPIHIDLPTGALIVASVKTATPIRMVDYYLVLGGAEKPTYEELKRRRGDSNVINTLFGGGNANDPMQFHDIAAGTHTLCVQVFVEPDGQLPFSCRDITVATDNTVELTLDL